MRRAQTSTEYIILVAVVIVIAVVVSSILGEFPGFGSGTSKRIDDYKLTTSKVAVQNYASITNYSLIKIKNNNYDTLTATAVNVNGEDCGDDSLPVSLKIGQTYTLNCSVNFTTTPAINIIWEDVETGASYATSENSSSSEDSNPSEDCTTSDDEDGDGEGQCGDSDCTSSEYCIVNDLRTGLVGYWPFDGDVLTDFSSLGNNLVASSVDCSGDLGFLNEGCTFENSGYLQTSNNIGVSGTMNRTISMWIKTSTEGFRLFGWGSPGGTSQKKVYDGIFTSGIIYIGIDGGNKQFTYNYADGNWHNLVFVQNGPTIGDLTIYSDNETLPVSSSSGSVNLATVDTPFRISGSYSSSGTWAGSIDEVAIWDRSLSQAEIEQLYNSGNGLSLIID